jgi:hypothetical protein
MKQMPTKALPIREAIMKIPCLSIENNACIDRTRGKGRSNLHKNKILGSLTTLDSFA